MAGSAKQSIAPLAHEEGWIASSLALLAMTVGSVRPLQRQSHAVIVRDDAMRFPHCDQKRTGLAFSFNNQ
jgi:hypothetical protein